MPVKFQNDRTTFLVMQCSLCYMLTHWGRVTHICVVNLTIVGSNNSLSPGRHQAIIRTNDGILLIGPLGTNFREILIEIHTVSFKKMHLKMSSGKMSAILFRPRCVKLQIDIGGKEPRFSLHCITDMKNITSAKQQFYDRSIWASSCGVLPC